MDNLSRVEAAKALLNLWSMYKAHTTLMVGLLADRRQGRIFRAAEQRGYAILTCLEAINRGCRGNPPMAGLWKSMTPEGVIYLCHHEPVETWKTVVFEIDFLPAAMSEHLEMVVSTFVPFGAGGDPTHYPPDVSSHYRRSTQELFPVIEGSVSTSMRRASHGEDSEERATGWIQSREEICRNGVTLTNTRSEREQHSQTDGAEYGDNRYIGTNLRPHPANAGGNYPDNHTTNLQKHGWTSQWETDAREESQRTQGRETSASDKNFSDDTTRHKATKTDDGFTEIRYDVKCAAVGIDYSQVDRLFAAWRAQPANKEPSKLIDYFLRGLSDCNETLQEGISQKIIDHREHPELQLSGPELGAAFLDQARQLVMIEEGDLPLQRRIMPLDGTLRPIDIGAVRQLIEGAGDKLPVLGPTFGGAVPLLLTE